MTEGALPGVAAQTLLQEGAPGGPVSAAPGADARFAAAMDQARERQAAAPATEAAIEPANPAMQGVFDKLSGLDAQAKGLADEAKAAQASGGEFTPGEMVMLSVKAQEFMFNAQITSNMANRTSDGISQLFRQQS